MIVEVAFAAILFGLVKPGFVRRRGAFGASIVLMVLVLLSDSVGAFSAGALVPVFRGAVEGRPNWGWITAISLISGLARLMVFVVGVLLLVAYWPGGGLLDIHETGADEHTERPGGSTPPASV